MEISRNLFDEQACPSTTADYQRSPKTVNGGDAPCLPMLPEMPNIESQLELRSFPSRLPIPRTFQ